VHRACETYICSYKHLQVIDGDVTVHDSNGEEIESQILPLAEVFVNLRNYYVKAYLGQNPSKTPKYWLAFTVSVPPFGFSTYTVSTAKKAGTNIGFLLFIKHMFIRFPCS
jgi:alpha-mannosidase